MKNLFYGEKHSFIEWTYFVRQFQCVPTTYVIEIKETYFEIYTNKYHVHRLSSFKHLKLPISIKIPVTIYIANCLYLHDSYITKFDFMNYAFPKLAVAW